MSAESVELLRPGGPRRRVHVGRALALATAVGAVSLAGCGKSSDHLSYQQRVRSLEALLVSCNGEASDEGYRRCLRRTEGTVRSYLQQLCPHPGGYTFEGQHEPCPNEP